jgi:hypothetical protein
MNPPRSFGFVAVVFTVVYVLAYVIAVGNNYALFTYHPLPGTLAMGVEKPYDGPAMYWYGWMATAAIAALGASLIACLLPQRTANRVWSGWAWVAALGVLLTFAYLLRGYFLR